MGCLCKHISNASLRIDANLPNEFAKFLTALQFDPFAAIELIDPNLACSD
jgi:hypothetical protein